MYKNKLYLIFLAACCLLLASCRVGKSYVRPELALPDSLTTQQDSLSFADVQWQTIYTDTALRRLINQALEYNKDMLMAAARVKELAAMKRIDYAKLFPELSLRAYAEKEGENYGGNNYKTDNELDLKAIASWELDLWGNLRWARDKSLSEFLASVENQRALRMTLVAEVAASYFELVALDNELAIVKQTTNARQESLHLTRLRYEGGLTSEVPYRQAQVELARTATLVPELEKEVTLKENELAFLTGEYPHRIARTTSLEDVQLPDNLPVGLPSSLLERRPDIRQAEQQLRAANAAVGVAYTNMFPRISMTVTLGVENEVISHLLASPHHLIATNLLQPLFAMGKNRAMLKAKKAAYERATYAYEKAVLNAFKDAYNAIADFNKMKEIYDTRRTLEQSSRTTLELAQLQYVNGVIGYMDLLDAQRVYLSAQISLSQAIRDKQLTLVNLYKALGGGWQVE